MITISGVCSIPAFLLYHYTAALPYWEFYANETLHIHRVVAMLIFLFFVISYYLLMIFFVVHSFSNNIQVSSSSRTRGKVQAKVRQLARKEKKEDEAYFQISMKPWEIPANQKKYKLEEFGLKKGNVPSNKQEQREKNMLVLKRRTIKKENIPEYENKEHYIPKKKNLVPVA